MALTPESPDRDWLGEMLRRAVAGDENAWRALVEAYSGRVFGLLRAQCNDADLSEEITQSTFCTIVVKIGAYAEVGKFEQWLFRIAMNRLRDEMRRRKRQARPIEDDTLTALAGSAGDRPAGGPGPAGRAGAGGGPGGASEGLYDAADFQALRHALTELSESDQNIIHLRHQAGLSFKQIAEILDQPLGTVLARQHRALKKLGEIISARLGQPGTGGAGPRRPGGARGGEE